MTFSSGSKYYVKRAEAEDTYLGHARADHVAAPSYALATVRAYRQVHLLAELGQVLSQAVDGTVFGTVSLVLYAHD